MEKSKCRQCSRYSCEMTAIIKQEDGTNILDESRRFRFNLNSNGAICGGEPVPNSIDNCEITARQQDNSIVRIIPSEIQHAITKQIKKDRKKKRKQAKLGNIVFNQ